MHLGARVWSKELESNKRHRGRDIDQSILLAVTFTILLKMLKGILSHVDIGRDIGLKHCFNKVRRRVKKLLVLHDACIVDHKTHSLLIIEHLSEVFRL